MWKAIGTVLVIASVVTIVVLVSIGFKADSQQETAISALPELVDNVIVWKDDVCKSMQDMWDISKSSFKYVFSS